MWLTGAHHRIKALFDHIDDLIGEIEIQLGPVISTLVSSLVDGKTL